MFLVLPDLGPLVRGWIRILLSSSKNSKKTLIPFVTSLDFLSLKNDVNVPVAPSDGDFVIGPWRLQRPGTTAGNRQQ
jgi:hypothetical protein